LILAKAGSMGSRSGAVGRRESSFGAYAFDGLADAGDLVRVEIVHDNHISGFEGGDEDLLDIGANLFAVDRAVEDAGRGEAVMAQRGDKGRGLPGAERSMRDQALAFLTAAVTRRHVGRGPGLVNEHQPARIKALLVFTPGGARVGDVRPLLFGGAQSLFLNVSSMRRRKRSTDERPTLIPSTASSLCSSEIGMCESFNSI
jgi:hypothetical protein